MLLVPTFNGFQWKAYTTPDPSITPGTSITAGNGSKGSWGEILSALANDVYGLLLWINAGYLSNYQRDYLIDIGTDPAGGTSYSVIINNILCHQASNAIDGGGRWFYFPFFIKAGSTVGARAQSNGAYTIRVAAIAYGRPTNPEVALVGQYSETIGVSGNGGTLVTPGASAAEGDWTLLGVTTRNCWWWQLCVGFSYFITNSRMYYCDLGVGDASNKHLIIENLPLFHPGGAEKTGNPLTIDGFWEVPAGANLYARVSCSGTPDNNCNALAVGVGG